jgi:oligopeptidase B
VIEYLNAENKYCEEEMSPLKPLREKLYDEMLSHLKETDEDVKRPNY